MFVGLRLIRGRGRRGVRLQRGPGRGRRGWEGPPPVLL